MSMFFMACGAKAAAKKPEPFLLTVAATAGNLQYGVTPYWTSGGGCVIEWGDGQSTTAATSGTTINHTYAAAGSYTVRVSGDMYRFRASATNPGAVTFCNGNWSALGSITDGSSMFYNCANMDILVDRLPSGLTSGQSMFNGCKAATLPLASLPDGLTNGANMFQDCNASLMSIPRLPSVLTGAGYMFYRCWKMTADLDAWAANNPGGWRSLTNCNYMLYGAGSDNSPGAVTGNRSAFQALCPNATFTAAFNNTNTTA